MIVDGKKFAAELGKCLKSGYNLRAADGHICIYTMEWLFRAKMEKLPREILAELVMHLGTVPQDCCLRAWKDKDGYQVQSMMEDVFQEGAEDFDDAQELEEVRDTGLRWGTALYQAQAGWIVGVSLNRRLLCEGAKTCYAAGEQSVLWMDAESTIAFRAYRPEPNTDVRQQWTALETVQWCTWDKPC